MANESTMFGLSLVGVLAGLGVLIYGVTLTNGEELNEIMLAGGVIVLAAFGLFTLGVARLDEPEGSGH
jgi:cytochrome c biogenesis protein CcdA